MCYEKDLDDLNKRISDNTIKTNEVQSYVKNNKKLKDDVVKRRQIEAEFIGLKLEYEKLEKINNAWPVAEAKASEISKKLPELESKITKFNKERGGAESYQKGKQLLDKYNRVEQKKQVVDNANKSLENVNKLTGDDLKSIRELFNKKNRFDASLSAGKLSVKFTSKKSTELEIQEGAEDRYRRKTERGQTMDFKAHALFDFTRVIPAILNAIKEKLMSTELKPVKVKYHLTCLMEVSELQGFSNRCSNVSSAGC